MLCDVASYQRRVSLFHSSNTAPISRPRDLQPRFVKEKMTSGMVGLPVLVGGLLFFHQNILGKVGFLGGYGVVVGMFEQPYL